MKTPPARRRTTSYLPIRYLGNYNSNESDVGLEEDLLSGDKQHKSCKCSESCRLFRRLATGNVEADDRIVDLFSVRDLRAWAKECYQAGFADGEESEATALEQSIKKAVSAVEQDMKEKNRQACVAARAKGWREGAQVQESEQTAVLKAEHAKTGLGARMKYILWRLLRHNPDCRDPDFEQEKVYAS